MLVRSLSVVVVALLLVVGAGAGLAMWQSQERADALAAAEREVLASLDRVSATLRALGAAQEAYVVPGQTDQPWFERVSAAVQQLYDELAALAASTRSAGAPSRLQSLTAGVDSLLATDIQVRELLRLDQELMAADVILGDGRAAVDALVADVLALADAERNAFGAARQTARRGATEAAAAAGVVWLVGALLLAWRPARAAAAPVETPAAEASPAGASGVPEAPATGDDAAGDAADAFRLDDLGTTPPEPAPSPLDLDAVTDVAAAIAQVTTGDQIPPLLERAVPALGATGLMLWMAAGEELFPVVAAGYPRRVIRQLRPLPRGAGNAPVSAWTSGRVRTVAGDASANGAVVAPLFGVDRTIGVLAAEMPQGREQAPEVRAAVTLLAAQLAGIVPAWPAASGTAAAPAQPDADTNPPLEAASGE